MHNEARLRKKRKGPGPQCTLVLCRVRVKTNLAKDIKLVNLSLIRRPGLRSIQKSFEYDDLVNYIVSNLISLLSQILYYHLHTYAAS